MLVVVVVMVGIPDNSHQHHQRRWCKIFQVRGIFSILNATHTCVIMNVVFIPHMVCNFTHSV